MAVVLEAGTPRTYLEAVQYICQMSGVNPPDTLDSPDRNTIRAMLAVKQALNTVWYKHARWPWRWRWSIIEMLADQMWYELPAAFNNAGCTVGVHKTVGSLTYKPYEWLVEQCPFIRSLPPEFGDEDTEAEVIDANYSGVPNYWTIQGGYLGLWYPPSQDFIDATAVKLIVGHYTNLIDPVAGSDELGLPMDILPAHENIALGIFGRYREWPDWKVTMEIGYSQLNDAMARARRAGWESSQLMPED